MDLIVKCATIHVAVTSSLIVVNVVPSIASLLSISFRKALGESNLQLLNSKSSVRLISTSSINSTKVKYSWRSLSSYKKSSEGGQIPELYCGTLTVQNNWHYPFFGFPDDVSTNDIIEKDSKVKSGCLLCGSLMNNKKYTLERHLISQHTLWYNKLCPQSIKKEKETSSLVQGTLASGYYFPIH